MRRWDTGVRSRNEPLTTACGVRPGVVELLAREQAAPAIFDSRSPAAHAPRPFPANMSDTADTAPPTA